MNVNPFSYLIEKLKSKVNVNGDFMTGNLIIQKSGETYCQAKSADTTVGVYLDSDTNGDNGIWSTGYYDGTYHASGKWIIKRDTNNEILVNGTKIPSNGGTVALKSDYTPTLGTTSDGYIYWARSGHVATIRIINGNFSNTGAGTSFYILPSNLLPLIGADQRDSYSNKRIQIETDGRMVCAESISNVILRGSFTYICQ